ncbi:hypothetical protein [Pandoraea communis]|uniref:hypothetical protein n=1 Tax=Pandoraea communis TaxID=2508297 RepID=UPI0025A5BCB5|nr:hypothetical protein [Pandoraea communis]MDM8356176.1 hypothetical protein [Pandoraea communis]
MDWIKALLRRIRRKMKPCDHRTCVDQIEDSLGIDLDPFDIEFVETLCELGYHCNEIQACIAYRRKKYALKRLLEKAGFSASEIEQLLADYNDDLIGDSSAKEIFDKIQTDLNPTIREKQI